MYTNLYTVIYFENNIGQDYTLPASLYQTIIWSDSVIKPAKILEEL